MRLVEGITAIHPDELLKLDGTPYKVFTPFMRNWRKVYDQKARQVTKKMKHFNTYDVINSIAIDDLNINGGGKFKAGENYANELLYEFLNEGDGSVKDYAVTRDYPAQNGTANISPYIKFGMISMNHVLHEAFDVLQKANRQEKVQSIEKWIDELIWREFYQYILYHYPHTTVSNFREKYDHIAWENNRENIQAWKNGETGFPFVDAGMRQLNDTGWMHNRLRMVVASFLVKNLLVDWRIGEAYFMQKLIDGDTASNVGGWQWVAGTGTDAAPYFRIFNPITQGKKFDADGAYIRTWIPELEQVPDKYIHMPWRMPDDVQQNARCIIGRDYPERIINLKDSRERALLAYKT